MKKLFVLSIASLVISASAQTNLLSFDASKLIPTKESFLSSFSTSVGIGYNNTTHSGSQDYVIDATLAPALDIGVVMFHDHYGWSAGAFSFNVTGQFGPFVGIAGAGPGYDRTLKKPMAYLFVGVGYPLQVWDFQVTPSLEVANMTDRPGTTELFNVTVKYHKKK